MNEKNNEELFYNNKENEEKVIDKINNKNNHSGEQEINNKRESPENKLYKRTVLAATALAYNIDISEISCKTPQVPQKIRKRKSPICSYNSASYQLESETDKISTIITKNNNAPSSLVVKKQSETNNISAASTNNVPGSKIYDMSTINNISDKDELLSLVTKKQLEAVTKNNTSITKINIPVRKDVSFNPIFSDTSVSIKLISKASKLVNQETSSISTSSLKSEPITVSTNQEVLKSNLFLQPHCPQPSCSTQVNPILPVYSNLSSSSLVSESKALGMVTQMELEVPDNNASNGLLVSLNNECSSSSLIDSKPEDRNDLSLEDMYKCHMCDTIFPSNESLIQHVRTMHYVPCKLCHRIVPDSLLYYHYILYHNNTLYT